MKGKLSELMQDMINGNEIETADGKWLITHIEFDGNVWYDEHAHKFKYGGVEVTLDLRRLFPGGYEEAEGRLTSEGEVAVGSAMINRYIPRF